MINNWLSRKVSTFNRIRDSLYELDQIYGRLDNLENLPYEIVERVNDGTIRFPKIASIEETYRQLKSEGVSICRFGDAEFNLILGESQPAQEAVPMLSRRLGEILRTDSNAVLVGIPDIFGSLDTYTNPVKEFWRGYLVAKRQAIYHLLDLENTYHNSQITRPYIQYADKSKSGDKFQALRQLWDQKSVVIVEGQNTRFGRCNNLLDNALSVKRIICPQRHAFAKFDEIFTRLVELPKNELVLIALGPTATVLAYDLAHDGRQAIDIGHIDIEYEWYLQKATSKVPIPGKHVNEARTKADLELVFDEVLESQVIGRIV